MNHRKPSILPHWSFSILGGLSENLCNVPFTQNWHSITKTNSSSPRTTPFLTEKFTCQCRNLSISSCLLLQTSVFPEDSILYSVCNWSHLTQVQNFPPYSLSVSYSECPAYQELPLNSFVPAHSVIPFGPNRHLSFSQDGSDPEPLPGRPWVSAYPCWIKKAAVLGFFIFPNA